MKRPATRHGQSALDPSAPAWKPWRRFAGARDFSVQDAAMTAPTWWSVPVYAEEREVFEDIPVPSITGPIHPTLHHQALVK